MLFLQRPSGRCRPDQVRRRHRWDPNVDDGEAVIIGTVRAVRNLLDASWPSCRIKFLTVHIQGAMEQAEASHAAADQVRVARDVATMFDELRAWPTCTPIGRGFRRSWNRRAPNWQGRGGHGGGG